MRSSGPKRIRSTVQADLEDRLSWGETLEKTNDQLVQNTPRLRTFNSHPHWSSSLHFLDALSMRNFIIRQSHDAEPSLARHQGFENLSNHVTDTDFCLHIGARQLSRQLLSPRQGRAFPVAAPAFVPRRLSSTPGKDRCATASGFPIFKNPPRPLGFPRPDPVLGNQLSESDLKLIGV